MGSEHSTQQSGQFPGQRQASLNQPPQGRQQAVIRRHNTVANPSADPSTGNNSLDGLDNGRPGSISPGPSICSDSDLPYISYTVNRPIGDSPKLVNKQVAKSKSVIQRKVTIKQPTKKPAHNIVVVKPAAAGPNIEKDPEILRLQSIPMFLPIMRGTINLPAVRDPEILEQLNPSPLYNLCIRYQNHLTTCANLVATEQNALTQKIREVDAEINKFVNTSTEKQKRFAKYAERLAKVHEVSHYLNRCHMLLNQTLESMETLNNYLCIEDRLEPFVWTTG